MRRSRRVSSSRRRRCVRRRVVRRRRAKRRPSVRRARSMPDQHRRRRRVWGVCMHAQRGLFGVVHDRRRLRATSSVRKRRVCARPRRALRGEYRRDHGRRPNRVHAVRVPGRRLPHDMRVAPSVHDCIRVLARTRVRSGYVPAARVGEWMRRQPPNQRGPCARRVRRTRGPPRRARPRAQASTCSIAGVGPRRRDDRSWPSRRERAIPKARHEGRAFKRTHSIHRVVATATLSRGVRGSRSPCLHRHGPKGRYGRK